MSKVNVKDIEYTNNPEEMADVDLFANGPIEYNLDGGFPMVNGDTLKGIFPNGKLPYGANKSSYGNKKWYFITNIINQAIAVISEQFDYFGLPDELNKYRIEEKLIRDGRAFMIYDDDQFYFVSATVSKTNIYNEATEIKINEPKWEHNKKTYTEFVEFTNDNSGQGIYNQLIQTVNSYIDCLSAMARDLDVSQPFGIVLGDKQNNKQTLELLNNMRNKKNVWLPYNVNKDDEDLINRLSRQGADNPFIIETSLTSQTDNIIKQVNFWDNQFNKIIGIPLSNLFKAERVIQAEVQSQQGVSEFIRENRFNKRQLALSKCKELWEDKCEEWDIEYNIVNQPLIKNEPDEEGEDDE